MLSAIALTASLSCAALAGTAGIARADSPSDQTVRNIIETFRQTPGCSKAGIVVGTNVGGNESEFASGTVTFPDGHTEAVAADTQFEVGSIAKTFTATLYAQLVAEGKIAPTDLLKDRLPAGSVPRFKDPDSGEMVDITLDQLARHTSGLPRQQPTITYPVTDDRMLASLDRVTLKTRPGVKYVYSNLGTALLAKALEHVTGQSLEALVAERITTPMNLPNTHFFVENDPHLPVGLDRAEQPADGYSSAWPAYRGASALVSTLDDMMIFLSANMDRGPADSPVARVLAKLQDWQTVPCASALEGGQGCASIETGLAWSRLQSKVPGLPTIWKNGMTKGFASWIGFVAPQPGEKSPSGVVVMASQGSCPVGPLAYCVLASLNGRPLAPTCLPQTKAIQ